MEKSKSDTTPVNWDPVVGVPTSHPAAGNRYRDEDAPGATQGNLPYSSPPQDEPKPYNG